MKDKTIVRPRLEERRKISAIDAFEGMEHVATFYSDDIAGEIDFLNLPRKIGKIVKAGDSSTVFETEIIVECKGLQDLLKIERYIETQINIERISITIDRRFTIST